MKRVFLLLFASFLFGGHHSIAQNLFQCVYGGDGYDSGCEVIQTSDDGFLIAGTSGSFEEGMSSQFLLVRTDADGLEIWRKTYGAELADVANSMIETSDGNLVIAGFTETVNMSYQICVIKVNIEGDTLWSKQYGGSGWDLCNQAVATSDGGCALLGQTYSYGSGNGDFYFLRLDADGDTLWTRTYGGAGLESGESISLTDEGGYYLSGYTESFGAGKKDVYVVKTDDLGNVIWDGAYGWAEDEYAYGSCTTNDGGIVVVGGTFSNSPDEGDFMVYKLSADGDSIKARLEDGSTDEYYLDVVEDDAGNLILVGYVEDSFWGKEDIRIFRVTSQLNFGGLAVSKGSEENDRGVDIKITSDNGYVMVGVTGGYLHRFDDVYLQKMNEQGETGPLVPGVGVIELDGLGFEVQIGPNPFSTQTPTLFIENFERLRTLIDGPISLRVYNPIGQEVYEKQVSVGQQNLDNLEIPAGVYLYQLGTSSQVLATGRLVKL